MKNNPLVELEKYGQSVWLDYIRRDFIVNGGLRRLIKDDGLRGITSNPSIFEKAIVDSHDYDEDIRSMANTGMDAKAIYEAISRRDVRMAADEFWPVYHETDGKDGYVSLEVNPHLAHDTNGTMKEARRLWSALDRPIVLIKVPGTVEGLPAISQAIFLYRKQKKIDGPLFLGMDTHALSEPALASALEVLAANGVEVMLAGG